MNILPDPWTVIMVTWLVVLLAAATVAYIWSLDEVSDDAPEPFSPPDPPKTRGRHREAVPGKTKPLRDLSPWRMRRA